MPFTLSHPAAVLPLIADGRGRGPLIASAMVAGSLAPDVPFFLESLLPGSYGLGGTAHRAWAVPTLDVAIAAGLVVGWHGLLREPLVALLPDPWADRADALTAPSRKPAPGRFGSCQPADAAWFAASAALGAFSHVGWDAFTHHGRAGVRRFPALRRTVGGMPVYHALQWGTSAVGLGLIAASGSAALRRRELPQPRRITLRPGVRRVAVAAVAASTVLGAVHRTARELPRSGGRLAPAELVAAASFGGGAGAAVGAAAVALAVRLTTRPDQARPAGAGAHGDAL
ncbi:DUF4184 family protein [Streptacidiphilus sp. N1-10]|uniref:DUF4184 family protein n=1 Tax=Streptacidiphilus jeojiensis TaxID=3229225 RepID=A0ABV6XZJ5_9ACTN